MRWSRPAAIAFIVVWLTVQLAVPIAGLTNDPPAERFVWKMFSTSTPRPEFVVHTDSRTESVDLDAITARLRADLPLTETIPEHICQITSGAISVTWENGSFSCRS